MDGNDGSVHHEGNPSAFGGDPTPAPLVDALADAGPVGPTALDQLNAELAILDRPLEDDIEYEDEPPPSRPWRRAGAALGALMLLAGVAGLAVTRRSAAALPALVAVAEAPSDSASGHPPDLTAPAEQPDAPTRGEPAAVQPARPHHRHGHAAHGSHHHHHHHHPAGR